MHEETDWRGLAESSELRYETLYQQVSRLKDEVRDVRELFAARKKRDGSYDIDFDKFVRQLGAEGALDLRRVIDEVYRISGAPGEKPKIKLVASTA